MAELSRSAVVEWINPQVLKGHPANQAIYGTDGVGDLIESIQHIGAILEPLYIRPDNTVVSGHRRWRAAKELGLVVVPVLRVSYANEDDEIAALIEYNGYRRKNGQQMYQEGIRLEVIYTKRAKERQQQAGRLYGNHPTDQLQQNFAEAGQTRQHVAKELDLGSGPQWDKLKEVGERALAGDEVAQDLLPKIWRSMSLHAAVKRVRREEANQVEAQRIAATPPDLTPKK